MVWAFFTGKGKEKEPMIPTTRPSLRKELSAKEKPSDELEVGVYSPSVQATLELLKKHSDAARTSLSRPFFPDIELQTMFVGLDITDMLLTGQLAGEVAEAVGPSDARMTGLEGYFIGIPLEQQAQIALQLGATLKGVVDSGTDTRHALSASIPDDLSRKNMEKLIKIRWGFGQICRTEIQKTAAAVRRSTGIGIDPRFIKVSIDTQQPQKRIITYQGAGMQMQTQQVTGRGLLQTSQAYYMLNIGQELAQSTDWQNAWQNYPVEMEYAQLAAHYDGALVDTLVQRYMATNGLRLY